MEFLGKTVESIRSIATRRTATQAISLGDLLFLHMNKSPIRSGEIVVFHVDGRDILIVHRVIMAIAPFAIHAGKRWKISMWRTQLMFPCLRNILAWKNRILDPELPSYVIEGEKRVQAITEILWASKVNQQRDTGEITILTKGDNNSLDDSYGIYADGQLWLQQNHVMGRVLGFLPYAGWATIIMTANPIIKAHWRKAL